MHSVLNWHDRPTPHLPNKYGQIHFAPVHDDGALIEVAFKPEIEVAGQAIILLF